MLFIIRSSRNRKKINDDHRDNSGKTVDVSHSIQEIKNNGDDKKSINSKNGVTTIINIDVPESQNADNQISLGEHEINKKQIASNVTTATTAISIIRTTTDIDRNADADLIGGDAWLRQKQWHRRLHTPVWARCSILKSNNFFFYTFCANLVCFSIYSTLSLSILYISNSVQHTPFSVTDSI